MTEEQIKQLRQQLLTEKHELEQRDQENNHYGLKDSMRDTIGELSLYDNHPGDIGSEVFERGKDLALNDLDDHHHNDIEEALHRIETGEYGICEICHQEIPYERLEAVPWTKYCIEHQPQQHSSIRRPVEEKVLDSPTHTFFDTKDYNAFDGEDAWQEVERYGTSNPPDYFREGDDYDHLYIDHDEHRGYVDLVEGVAITDLYGHVTGFAEITHNEAYRKKEQEEFGFDDDIMEY